ncbi:hypothetical protein [uncultured Mucilaginibacter sp.]|uniref:hypothetical protein n=1 Tax=uncultured Mucilaginibacter sp. TaxID=797541 RepID=UPI002628F772|nr:hypothetical protein [uncultured Mucilaginibacter sp.]
MEKVTEIVKEVYKNKEAIKEVNAAIIAKIYTDQSILLKDMIYPGEGLLTTSKSFKKLSSDLNIQAGTFSKAFWVEVAKKNDTEFNSFLTALKPGNDSKDKLNQKKVQNLKANDYDPNQYQGLPPDGVSLYYPYAEQYINPFDNSGNYSPSTSVMTATAEADEGYGWQPIYDSNGNMGYTQVVINDDYAYANPTLIIGINGIEPLSETITNGVEAAFPPGPPVTIFGLTRTVRKVFVGDVRVSKHQYDHFISFSGNGGGSEIRFTRASGYLKVIDGQVQPTADVFLVNGPYNVSRGDIRNSRWVNWTATWDADWQQDNLEQNLAIYEDDNTSSSTLNLSVTTTVSVGGQKQTGTVGGTITYKSLDDIIRQNNHKYASFFPFNRGEGGEPTYAGWLIFDNYSTVSFTLPDKLFIQ